MSRVSEAEKFKKKCDDTLELVSEIRNPNVVTRNNIEIIAAAATRCLVLLAEIADILEKKNE